MLVAHTKVPVSVLDHVLNDEEVLLETAIRNDRHFLTDTLINDTQLLICRARVSDFNALAGNTLQIRCLILAAQVNARPAVLVVLDHAEPTLTHFSDNTRASERRFRVIVTEPAATQRGVHFVSGFHVVAVAVKREPRATLVHCLVVHGRPGVHAQHLLMTNGLLGACVMRVVRRQQAQNILTVAPL